MRPNRMSGPPPNRGMPLARGFRIGPTHGNALSSALGSRRRMRVLGVFPSPPGPRNHPVVHHGARAREPGVRFLSTANDHPLAAIEPLARSEEHTSELQSLMRISYAVFCLKKKKKTR